MPKVPVFLSFSGKRSKAVALLLHGWLKDVLQNVKPWTSERDIEAGVRWGVEIAGQLATTNAGILCITPENSRPKVAEWLMFEAGALSKMDRSKVTCLCLFGVGVADLRKPLSEFQNTAADDPDSMIKLVSSINSELKEDALEPERIRRQVEHYWDDWTNGLAKAKDIKIDDAPVSGPSDSERLEEVLTRLKSVESDLSRLAHGVPRRHSEASLVDSSSFAAPRVVVDNPSDAAILFGQLESDRARLEQILEGLVEKLKGESSRVVRVKIEERIAHWRSELIYTNRVRDALLHRFPGLIVDVSPNKRIDV